MYSSPCRARHVGERAGVTKPFDHVTRSPGLPALGKRGWVGRTLFTTYLSLCQLRPSVAVLADRSASKDANFTLWLSSTSSRGLPHDHSPAFRSNAPALIISAIRGRVSSAGSPSGSTTSASTIFLGSTS